MRRAGGAGGMRWAIGLLLGAGLCAQTAAIRGVVSDASGAVVPGATVVVSGTGLRKTSD